ncbi:SDR family NAD(P)-dependent oxidoreductase [Acidobacterium sp. S8]|uniref:SDR family NAD(P)-dependent oxidoreductase n=1 Tax=Acidobacterium sp. S8 TaxID=1641854 RepID=UPI00131B7CFA|nr:SDR family NAD(P)-dependent oxidoreductase [Acidobacterium sp. S8]
MMEKTPISLTPEQQTLVALRALRRRVEELEQREPIAIVGMACRIPGGANDPEAFWNLLLQKRNVVTEIPRERMDLDTIFDAHPQTPGKTYSRWAAMLDAPGDFDAEFFGISPREAVTADPQQRLLLETSWEALENAGIDPKSLAGQDAGVFVGICGAEYARHYQKCVQSEALVAHFMQGSALNAAAGRISYFYGLQGPCMAIDTACSSSLVAVDRACRSLMQRETGLAIVGGANILATSDMLIMGSQWGMLSPRGACRTFDAGADGFVRGEGCGVIVLKRLRDAEANGDPVLAVILGSAVNQDGASSGLTVPNGQAQQELLRRAHSNASIEPWQVGYVEAHGTGTTLGDPIEAEALGAVFSEGRKRDRPLPLGSVKTNIGHLEAAAGIAGLMKVVLALNHGVVPAQLYWEQPSEHVSWDELSLEVVTEARTWEPIEGRRIAGVSSFGFSGTNAHVVVEAFEDTRVSERSTRAAEILAISARTSSALNGLVARYAEFLQRTEASWGEICHSAANGRSAFVERLAVIAKDKAEAVARLNRWLQNESTAPEIHHGRLRLGERVRIGLVFGDDLHLLDRLLGRPADSEAMRKQAWMSKWADLGADPVVVASSGSSLHTQLATAAVNLVIVVGSLSEKFSIPTVRLTVTADWRALANVVAELFVHGLPVDWSKWENGLKHRRVWLPNYAFQRERFWIEPQSSRQEIAGMTTGHALLGNRLRAAGVKGQFESVLMLTGATSWIGEHIVEGQPVLPATAHLELMMEATAEIVGPQDISLEDLILQAPLTVSATRTVQTVVETAVAGRSRVRIYAENDRQEWETMSECWMRSSGAAETKIEQIDLDAIRLRLKQTGPAAFYSQMTDRGVSFGPAFQGIETLWTGQDEALGEIRSTYKEDGYVISPWRLDACLQVAASLVDDDGLYLPLSAEVFRKYGPFGERCWSHVRIERIDGDMFTADLTIAHPDGRVVAKIEGLRFRRRATGTSRTGIYGVDWIPAKLAEHPANVSGHWLITGDDQRFADELAQQMREQGATCTVVSDQEVVPRILREASTEARRIEGVVAISQPRFLHEDTALRLEKPHAYTYTLLLLQTLVREQIHPASGVWLVTRGAQQVSDLEMDVSVGGRAVWGLRRTAEMEFPELRTHAIDLDVDGSAAEILRTFGSSEAEIAWRNGFASTPRLTKRAISEEDPAEPPNIEVQTSKSGIIEDLVSMIVPRKAPSADEIEIEVRAHGINFRDVMNTLGMLPGFSQQLGAECAGIVIRAGESSGFKAGDRVFAFAIGSFRTFATVKGRNAAKIPDKFSFAQAAVLPVAYLTAMFGLDKLAKLRKGERILIHSAAGGLGLAAVQLARARGAEIFATAGNEEKQQYLRMLGIKHVLSSRTTDFASDVMRISGGHGVDVVLNSLTGALAESSLHVLAHSARFLEVGKRDVLTREQVAKARPDIKHFKYDLSEEGERDPLLIPSLMQEMLQMLQSGELPPLPVTEFDSAVDALRFMSQARHIGKLAVTRKHPSTRTVAIDPKATYLITGGTGGVGMHFAEWLVRRGARHLILLSRRGGDQASQAALAKLRDVGVDVRVERIDITDFTALHQCIGSISKDAPIKGILHAAGVIDDRSLLRQTSESFINVAQPKWEGAWNLHQLTHNLPLDFFVLFSAAATLFGMPGQANYSAANAMLDGLAVYRRGQGLPALSVWWGPWAGAGMAEALHPADFGFAWVTAEDGTSALERLLASSEITSAVLPVVSWNRFVSQRPAHASSLFAALADPLDSVPRSEENARMSSSPPPAHKKSFSDLLAQAEASDRRQLLMEMLRQQIVQILSLGAQSVIDEDAALHDLGLDSLMAVELRNTLQVSLDRQLSPTLVLDYPTLRALRETLLAEIFGVERASEDINGWPQEITELSDSEAEALLLAELETLSHVSKH